MILIKGDKEMKNYSKAIIKMLIAAIMLGVCVGTAFAVAQQQQITATLDSGIKIVYSGVEQTMKDANGNVVYPIIYNGTTYVPIRAVSNMLGVSVDWKEETRSVLLGAQTLPLEDASMFNGHSYKFFDLSMTWYEAKAYCESLGGYLATITTAAEQKFIENLISRGGQNQYWLGGTDEKSEGNWEWITGEPWIYSNWDSPEPNGGRNENYLAIFRLDEPHKSNKQYFWNDLANDPHNTAYPFYDLKYLGFVCEWDM
jgi:hypothetical protein